MPEALEEFNLLAERIKLAKEEDRRLIKEVEEKNKEWKNANLHLTNLNKEMRNLVDTMVNNATFIPSDLDEKAKEKEKPPKPAAFRPLIGGIDDKGKG